MKVHNKAMFWNGTYCGNAHAFPTRSLEEGKGKVGRRNILYSSTLPSSSLFLKTEKEEKHKFSRSHFANTTHIQILPSHKKTSEELIKNSYIFETLLLSVIHVIKAFVICYV